MSDAKKLSSGDAPFLYLEMPMHAVSMSIFRLSEEDKGGFKAMMQHASRVLRAR
jgi:hypothetical protein